MKKACESNSTPPREPILSFIIVYVDEILNSYYLSYWQYTVMVTSN